MCDIFIGEFYFSFFFCKYLREDGDGGIGA